jgi:hypothetical protein
MDVTNGSRNMHPLARNIATAEARPDFQRMAGVGYLLPAATREIADLQASLRLARVDFMQATFAARRRASAQCCFTSAEHDFAPAAVAATKS